MSGTSIEFAKQNPLVYYGSLAFYNFGGSWVTEPLRAVYSGINLFQLYSAGSRYGELQQALRDEKSETANDTKNWVNYKSVDEMKKFWWVQIARAISGIVFVFFAPLLWTLRDLIYVRDQQTPYKVPFSQNFLGYDELMEAKAWMASTSAYINAHMQTAKPAQLDPSAGSTPPPTTPPDPNIT